MTNHRDKTIENLRDQQQSLSGPDGSLMRFKKWLLHRNFDDLYENWVLEDKPYLEPTLVMVNGNVELRILGYSHDSVLRFREDELYPMQMFKTEHHALMSIGRGSIDYTRWMGALRYGNVIDGYTYRHSDGRYNLTTFQKVKMKCLRWLDDRFFALVGVFIVASIFIMAIK